MAGRLSVVINTLNEARDLPRVLLSVKDIASEIVVCDMESTDESVKIAKGYGAKVFTHKRISYVEPARNFAINKAAGGWILVLDADEEVAPKLRHKITEIVKADEVQYVRIPRKNIIFGHFMKHTNWWPDYNIRLFKKGSVVWDNTIHSAPVATGKGLDLEADPEFAILHHTYDSIEKYIEHLNRYTTVQAELKIKSGYRFSWRDMLARPVNEFCARYFKGEGYKDGPHGLALSLMQAASELVFYLKIWQASNFDVQKMTLTEVVAEMRKNERDLHYWQGDSMFKETGGLKDRIIRKFRI